MANVRKKISELTALTSASLDTTIVGVDNGTTYKIELDTLADAVTSRVNILDRNRLSSLESVTSSFETKGSGILSGSISYTSLTNIPQGIVSQSTNLSSLNSFTQSIDSRVDSLENSTGSFLTSLNGAISSSSQLTSSYDTRYTLSGSVPNIPTGSFATTGSNTFIGEQIISSSLIVTNEIKGIGNIFLQPDVNDARYFQIYNTAAPSGNDIHFKGNTDFNYFGDDTNYLKIDDSAQTVSIVGVNGVFVGSSLNVTGVVSASAGFTGSIIGEINATNGVISGSSQLTSSFDTRYLNTGGDGVISGSSQLTSSFDTRYAISASFVSSSNLSSIQTITSASYAALTPVSGTLYIIIG
jgi:hypothetical protein